MLTLVRPNMTNIYVSSVDANGIPIGNDSTGRGTAAAPFLTGDQAAKSAASTATIRFNGDPDSPPTYTIPGNIDKAWALRGSVTGSKTAVLAGTNTNAALTLAPLSGQTITLQDIIVDPSLNTAGAAASAVLLTTATTTYALVASNVTFRNWTTHGIVCTTAVANKLNLTLTNCTLEADGVQSAIRLQGHSAGSITISGGETTITNQTASYTPVIYASCTTEGGPTASITDHAMSVGVDDTLVGANSHFGCWIENYLAASISGGSYGMFTAAPNRQCYVVGIASGVVSGGGSQLSINGSVLSGATVTHDAPAGGILAMINPDSSGLDKTKAQDCILDSLALTGTGSAHGLFVCGTTRAVIRNSTVTNVGLGGATKLASATEIYNNNISECGSSIIQWKGTDNVVQYGNTWTQLTKTGTMFTVQTAPEDGSTCTGTITGDHFVVNGAAGVAFVGVNASNSATFAENDYHLTSGSVAANPWAYQGTTYNTFAGWQATHGPTDTSNIP